MLAHVSLANIFLESVAHLILETCPLPGRTSALLCGSAFRVVSKVPSLLKLIRASYVTLKEVCETGSSWPGTYHVDQGDVDSQRAAGTCFFSAGMRGVSIAGVVYLAVWLHPDCVTVKGTESFPQDLS